MDMWREIADALREAIARGDYPPGATIPKEPEMKSGHEFPVSVKGVVVNHGKVVLLLNERGEWELPGGKLEPGEEPADCVVREIVEETGWQVAAGPVLDSWQYHIRPRRDVVIITYGCHVTAAADLTVSREHKKAGLFAADEVPALPMPDGYKRSIAAWFAQLDADLAGHQ